MKLLDYRVIWIDDQPDKAESYFESINNKIGRMGFTLSADWISTQGDLDNLLNNLKNVQRHDLIMVDWKLGKMCSDTGAVVAQKIRRKCSFSTIIFYSAEEPHRLRQEIARLLIDGVFCVNRTHFVDEAMRVIRATLARYDDLTMMRGLFLALVAEFDEMVRDSVLKGGEKTSEQVNRKQIDGLLAAVLKFREQKLEEVRNLPESFDLLKTIRLLRPGSKELVDCLIRLMSLTEPSDAHFNALAKLKRYESEILVPRNDMAHVVEREEGGRRFLARGDREWDVSKFEGLRQVLRDHYNNLNDIKSCLIDEMVARLAVTDNANSTKKISR